MNNIIKKIAAFTMAFTLLGSGAAIAENVSPKSFNNLTASAASCQHHGYCYRTTSNWSTYAVGIKAGKVTCYQSRRVNVKCGTCDKVTYSYTEYRTVTV